MISSIERKQIMKQLSRPVLGLVSVSAVGVAIAVLLQFSSLGLETRPVPKFNIETTPINREGRGETSYATIVKKAAPSVVNIYSTRTVRTSQPEIPFLDDPRFRQFSGDNGNRRNRHPRTFEEQGLGSGVVVSSDGYILTANHV